MAKTKFNFRERIYQLFFNPNETDEIKAMSVGFGLFMGIVPIWGFQMLVALGISHLFKLNKALVILFANISFPPFIPAILWGSHFVGSFLVEKPNPLSFSNEISFEMVQKQGLQYVLGAIALSMATGFVGWAFAWATLKLSKRAI